MTRISSLFVASTLAILPLSAFAQQSAAPAKTAEPTGITTAAPNATAPVGGKMGGKTATMTQPAKPDVKTPAPGAKPEVHSMNTVTAPHHTKTNVPAKSAEPTKS